MTPELNAKLEKLKRNDQIGIHREEFIDGAFKESLIQGYFVFHTGEELFFSCESGSLFHIPLSEITNIKKIGGLLARVKDLKLNRFLG